MKFVTLAAAPKSMSSEFGDFALATMNDLLKRFRVSIEEIQDACQFVGLSDVSFFGDVQPFGVR